MQRVILVRGFHQQLSLSYDFTSALWNADLIRKGDARVNFTTFLFTSLIETANALHHLLEHDFITTSYMVSRGLVEGATNYCFLLQCEQEQFDKWVVYSRQKAFRLLDRSTSAGDLKFKIPNSGTPDPKEIPGLQDDLDRFTGAKGGEKTRWTDLTIEQRLERLMSYKPENKSVVNVLLIALTTVFDIGSEALHGTLLGSGIQWGLSPMGLPLSGPNKARDELMFAAIASMSSMLRCGSACIDFPEIADASTASLKATMRLLLRAGGKDPGASK